MRQVHGRGIVGTLEIRLFGTMSIERDGSPLAQVPSRRVRDLLSYLLIGRESAHSREHLAGVFWGDLETHRARHSFNTALWRLRRLLEHEGRGTTYLQIDGRQVGFNLGSDFRLDVAEFEHRCDWAAQLEDHSTDKAAALYRQAIDLYRGDLLTDCYDDWCLVERERLRRLYLQALDSLLAFHVKRNELTEAIDVAARILESDPLREEVHRDLIGLFIVSGQRAAALRQYRLCEQTLKRELGIEPMPETQSLFRTLLSNESERLDQSHMLEPVVRLPRRELNGANSLAGVLNILNEAQAQFERASDQLHEAALLVLRAVDQIEQNSLLNRPTEDDDPDLDELHDTVAHLAYIAEQFRALSVDA
ncbi:MAG: BTAD domain-containing putative transcriptional regulator [Nitrolancea sp.]